MNRRVVSITWERGATRGCAEAARSWERASGLCSRKLRAFREALLPEAARDFHGRGDLRDEDTGHDDRHEQRRDHRRGDNPIQCSAYVKGPPAACRWIGGQRKDHHRRKYRRWSSGPRKRIRCRSQWTGGASSRRAYARAAQEAMMWPRLYRTGPPGAVRFGEADNPGPGEGADELPLRPRPDHDDLNYPEAHRDGFRAIRSAGFDHRREDSAKAAGQFTMIMETANSTGWRALKNRLNSTSAHVLYAQETRIRACDVPTASNWASRRGWKSVWCPAIRGRRGGPAAGVAVFVKDFIGLRLPPRGGQTVYAGRAVACVIDAPGYRPFLAVSAYGFTSKGATSDNAGLLRSIGQRIRCQGEGWQFVVAGDFNMTPEQMAAAGFAEQLGGVIVKPSTTRGTCRTPTSSRTLDYCVMSDAMGMAVRSVDTVEHSSMKTHVPVVIELFPRAAAMKALYIRPPPRIPTERVYGPIPQLCDWGEAARVAEEAVEMARKEGRDAAEDKLETAFKRWADVAEMELCDVTGTALPKYGLRGLRPNIVWRSILPERAPRESYPRTAAVTTLAGIAMELVRLAEGGTGDRGDEDEAADPEGDDRGSRRAHDDVRDGDEEGEDNEETNEDGDDFNTDARDSLDEIVRTLNDFDEPPDDDEELRDLLGEVIKAAADTGRTIDERDARQSLPASPAAERIRLLREMRNRLRETQLRWTRSDEREARKEWQEWLLEGFDRGAKNAHAFSRSPQEWIPTQTRATDDFPYVTSDPIQLHEEQRRTYAQRWEAAAGPQRYEWHDRRALPRMTADCLRQASLQHKPGTAETFDGFHPRHYALLSNEGLEVLSALMEASELLGGVPRQLQLANMPLIAKAKGGFRGIGILPSFYRIWARGRRPEAEKWERDHQRAYFSAAKSNGAADTVWRQAARQEAGVASGREAAGLIYDLEAFYERIDRRKLLKRAEKTEFPTAVLRMCLSMYAAPRVVSMRGRASRQLHPRRGIIAGCPMATTLVMVFSLEPLDQLVAELPGSTDVDAHIDDFVLTGVETEGRLLADMRDAEMMLRRTLNREMGGSIAMSKAGVVASKRSIAKALCEAIPGLGNSHIEEVVNLGADFVAGRRRNVIKRRSKLRRRLAGAARRRKRLETIARVVGRRGMRIFTSGIGPAGTFGGAISGFDDSDLLAMRRLAAAGMTPRGRGRSLAMTHILNGVPTAQFEVAPVLQLSRMIWKGQFEREDAARRGTGLGDLATMWAKTSVHFIHSANRVREGAMGERTAGRARASREAWRSIRGPWGAAALTLARIGWKYEAPFTVTTDEGAEIDLTATAPALLKIQLVAGVKRSLERDVGRSLAKKSATYEGRRACLDLALAALKSSGAGSKLEKGAYQSALCGSAMTMSRAADLGYDVEDKCPLCGEPGDTIRHRTFFCRCTAQAVQAAVPRWFIDEAVRSSPRDPFWTTGVIPHPVDLAPQLAAEVEIVVEHGMQDGEERQARTAPPEGGGADTAVGGRVYIDGSAQPSAIDGLARAGACVAEVDDRGRMIKKLTCAVPAHLPQTSQAAEHLAAAIAFRCITRVATVYCDCLGVVKALNDQGGVATFAKRRYGGLLLDTVRDPARRRLCQRVQWIKAHRHEANAEDAEDLINIKGNAVADEGADEAVKQHVGIGGDLKTDIDFWEKRARLVVRAVGVAMAMFPPAPGDMKKRPRQIQTTEGGPGGARSDRQHQWRYDGGAWRCQRCWSWITGDKHPRDRAATLCEGGNRCADLERFTSKGHKMAWAEGQLPFAFCTRCGAWASRRPRKLLKPCGEPSANGRLALRRIERNLHPWQKREQGGTLRPRSMIQVVTEPALDVGMPVAKAPRLSRGERPARTTESNRRGDDDIRRLDEHDDENMLDVDATAAVVKDAVIEELGAEVGHEPCGALHDQWSDEDVFGHGGSLEEPQGQAMSSPRADRKRKDLPGSALAQQRGGARSRTVAETANGFGRRYDGEAGGEVNVRTTKWEPQMPGSSTDGMATKIESRAEEARMEYEGLDDGKGWRGIGDSSFGTARAKGIAQNAVDACEAPGGPCNAGATEAVAPHASAAVTASVTAEHVAATLQPTGDYAREAVADRGEAAVGPPSGYAVPLDGWLEVTGNQRPGWSSPQNWPTSLGVGPSNGPDDCADNGDGPAMKVNVRRRDGVDAPSCSAAAARSGADAAVRGRREEPLEGSVPCDAGARNECDRPVMATGRAVKRRRKLELETAIGIDTVKGDSHDGQIRAGIGHGWRRSESQLCGGAPAERRERAAASGPELRHRTGGQDGPAEAGDAGNPRGARCEERGEPLAGALHHEGDLPRLGAGGHRRGHGYRPGDAHRPDGARDDRLPRAEGGRGDHSGRARGGPDLRRHGSAGNCGRGKTEAEPMVEGYDTGSYIMPWEREPSWLYLPHLSESRAEERAQVKRRRIEPPCDEKEDDHCPMRRGAVRHEQRRRMKDSESPPHRMEETRSAIGDEDERPGGAPIGDAAKDTKGNVIRGQCPLPGARRGLEPEGGGTLSCDDAQGSIGAAPAVRPYASGAKSGIRGQRQLPGASARTKREAAVECIQRMRALQEASRAARGDQGTLQPGESPSARLRALRERVAARAQPPNATPVCSTAGSEAATAVADHGNGAMAEERVDVVVGRRHRPAEELTSINAWKDSADQLRAASKPPERAD